MDAVFRPFEPGDEEAFRDLNTEWIARYFIVEEKDWEVLNDPVNKILRKGGAIFMAIYEGIAVGTCALLEMDDGGFEVAKMAVTEKRRGLGIGRKLLAHVVEHARSAGAKRLYLETNRKLGSAIHLYEALGFRHIPPQPSPYTRADTYMELVF